MFSQSKLNQIYQYKTHLRYQGYFFVHWTRDSFTKDSSLTLEKKFKKDSIKSEVVDHSGPKIQKGFPKHR